MLRRPLLLLAFLIPLAGCDQLGLEAASVTAARVEADGKAVGAACRYGARAIEDCFSLNRKVDKAAIYSGWREMDDYMRENKMEAVAPQLSPGTKSRTADSDDGASAPIAAADRPAEKVAKATVTKVDKSEKIAKIAKIDKSAAEKPAEH